MGCIPCYRPYGGQVHKYGIRPLRLYREIEKLMRKMVGIQTIWMVDLMSKCKVRA